MLLRAARFHSSWAAAAKVKPAKNWSSLLYVGIAPFCAATGLAVMLSEHRTQLHLEDKSQKAIFTRSQVSEHNTKESRIWVTSGTGVYDITEFVDSHPGGDKVMLAAGGAIDPYWKFYTIHNTPQVRKILEQYRIGELDPKSVLVDDVTPADINDPFANDPIRSPILRVHSQKPFNAETPAAILVDNFFTPTEVFYKRSHGPIPDVKRSEYLLELSGLGIAKPVTLTVDDLERLPQVNVTATLQCCGNRRDELQAVGPVQGLKWSTGAIGNATWIGVRLKDLLKIVPGVNFDELAAESLHVQFEGADGYGGSVPSRKALSQDGDVILALQMNGEELPREHGFPVRILIPGHVAARSVKWVNKIKFSKQESAHHFMQKDYKGFSPSADWEHLDWGKSIATQELPVQSAILEPRNNQAITTEDDVLTVKGYAWSGGGRAIIRVDVSADGGKKWHTAELEHDPSQSDYKSWAWTLWEVDIPVEAGKSDDKVELVCKAIDSSYNVQPNWVDGIYNRRGLLSNAWHRVYLVRK